MTGFVAKRIRFRTGERHSVLSRPGGLPVHEATLYLAGYRTRGRAANTIHSVCAALAVLYRWLDDSRIELLARLGTGKFLTPLEMGRLASATQYHAADLAEEEQPEGSATNIVDIRRIRFRQKATESKTHPVTSATQATMLIPAPS
jgi:hypothetical protein